MECPHLTTLADYEAERLRVEMLIDKSSRRAKGQWITYWRRLTKEINDYQKYKGEAK